MTAHEIHPEDLPAEFPYGAPAESEADMFIQWKGTHVCLDFHCDCGVSSHLDADFAHNLRCPGCGQVYQLGTQVIAKKVTPGTTTGAIQNPVVSG